MPSTRKNQPAQTDFYRPQHSQNTARCYEDVTVGEELPPLTVEPDTRQLVMYAGAAGDFVPIHYDKDVAQRAGHDRVIIQRLDAETKSPGGIVIPDSAAEKPIRGKVIAVGKGKILEDGNVRPLDVKVGDHILFGKYSGTEVKVDGEEYLVMREEDVMAVIEK